MSSAVTLTLTQKAHKVPHQRRWVIFFYDAGEELDMHHIILSHHVFWKGQKDIVGDQGDIRRKPRLGWTLRQGQVDRVDGSGRW